MTFVSVKDIASITFFLSYLPSYLAIFLLIFMSVSFAFFFGLFARIFVWLHSSYSRSLSLSVGLFYGQFFLLLLGANLLYNRVCPAVSQWLTHSVTHTHSQTAFLFDSYLSKWRLYNLFCVPKNVSILHRITFDAFSVCYSVSHSLV